MQFYLTLCNCDKIAAKPLQMDT